MNFWHSKNGCVLLSKHSISWPYNSILALDQQLINFHTATEIWTIRVTHVAWASDTLEVNLLILHYISYSARQAYKMFVYILFYGACLFS